MLYIRFSLIEKLMRHISFLYSIVQETHFEVTSRLHMPPPTQHGDSLMFQV